MFAFQQIINSTFPFLMITWAQQYVPASNTVVLAATTPIFAFLITWGITRHEPATLLKLAGAILGLAGTAVIIGLDALTGLGREIVAEMAILLATLSFACGTIFGVRMSGYNPTVVAAGSLLFGGLLLLPASLIIEHPWTLHPTVPSIVAAVTMAIFSSALGLMLFYMCLMRLGTLITNSQSYLRIPIGVGLSVLLLGEAGAAQSRRRPRAGHGRRRRDDHSGRADQALAAASAGWDGAPRATRLMRLKIGLYSLSEIVGLRRWRWTSSRRSMDADPCDPTRRSRCRAS